VKADREKTRIARKELERFKEKVKSEEPAILQEPKGKPTITVIQGKIGEGDFVRIKDRETVGQIIKIKGAQAEIAIGDLKSNIKLTRLEKISAKEYIRVTGTTVTGTPRLIGSDFNEKLKNFNSLLDLRGRRAEEVLPILNTYLDEALLLGKNEVRILHGKGDGILRNVIRSYLNNVDFIAHVRDEDVEKGGAGISVIQLK
jgi:DNA mismatch repair protein MutS2